MAKIDISVLLRAKDEASNVLTSLGNKLGKTGRDFDKFKKNALIASAGIAAVGAGALKLATDAGKFESVRDSFEGMTKGMIDSTDSFIDQVQRASAGTLSSMDIVGGATKALSLIGKESFSDFGTDFAKMAELSKKAARATGQDVNFMFESLITGTARSSKLILDNLGITLDMADAQSKYADELKKSNGLTDIQAQKASLLKTVIEELDKTYAGVSVTSGGLSGAQQKLRATLEDLNIALGTELLPIFNNFLRNVLLPFVENVGPKVAGVLRSVVSGFMSLPKPIQATLAGLVALLPALTILGAIAIPVKAAISAFGFLFGLIGIEGIAVLLLLITTVTIVIEVIRNMGFIVDWLKETWKLSFNTIKNEINNLSIKVNEWKGRLKLVFNIVNGFLIALWAHWKQKFSWIIDIINEFKEAMKVWKVRIETIFNLVGVALNTLKIFWVNKFSKMAEVVSWVTDKVSNFLRKVDELKNKFLAGATSEALKLVFGNLSFQTGGIVPGPIGQPALATVHGGEEVIPAGGQRRGGGGGVVFNVHIGLYAGTEVEKRNIARELYGALMRVAQARNTTVEDMVLSGS